MSTVMLQQSADQWRARYNLPPLQRLEPTARKRRSRAPRGHGGGVRSKSVNVALTRRLSIGLIALVWILAGLYVAQRWRAVANAPLKSPAAAESKAPVPAAPVASADTTAPDDRPAAAKIDVAVETSLVALRGYILTGDPGFKIEWQRSLRLMRSSSELLNRESESWVNGQQLLQLGSAQKTIGNLAAQQELVANLVGTADRYPGRRFYDEHVVADLDLTQRLSAMALDSILTTPNASRSPEDRAKVIDFLADLRGNIHLLNEGLPRYLESRSGQDMPADLQGAIAKLGEARTAITAMRYQVSPSDQILLEKIATSAETSIREIRQTVALHQGQRWDYADFAFKQQILPAAVDLLAVIRSWPTSGALSSRPD